jgi:CRP-like cAMP-binding protein
MPYSPLVAKLRAATRIRDEDAARLTSTCVSTEIKSRGTKVVSAGSKPLHLSFIVEGWAARYRVMPGGSRQITGLLIPGDFCDVHATIMPAMDHDIVALTDCRVGSINIAGLDDLISEVPVLARAIWRSALIDLVVLREAFACLAAGDPLASAAHLLYELHMRMSIIGLVKGNRFDLPIAPEEFGEAIGMTPDQVNRSLEDLRSRGLLELKDREVTILDLPSLQGLAGFNAKYLSFGNHAQR